MRVRGDHREGSDVPLYFFDPLDIELREVDLMTGTISALAG